MYKQVWEEFKRLLENVMDQRKKKVLQNVKKEK